MARRLFRFALTIVTILTALTVFGGQLGRWYPLYDLLNVLLLPAIIVLVVLLAVAAIMRLPVAGWVAAAGLLTAALQLGWGVAQPASVQQGAAPLRVASINAYHSNAQPELLARQLEQVDADIVLVQESNGTAAAQIAQALPDYYHVQNCPYDYCSMTVISRWPAQHIPLPKPEGPLSALLAARIQTPDGELQVINVHLPRPSQDFAIASRDAVLAAIDQLGPERLIVAGDFNQPSGSFALGVFTGEGKLWRHDLAGPTYPAHSWLGPVLDIDHIFTSRDLNSHGCERLPYNGSDHRAIACLMLVSSARRAIP